jgi:hypothetical protein
MRGRSFVLVVLMAAACSHSVPLQPTPPPVSVDVLDFLIGSPSSWPRLGSQPQNQFLDMDAREICWVKYANARTFECWRWDDRYIYHVVDHAIDGNTGESYRFSDGRWMPRHLSSGMWTLDLPANRITWFDPRCGVEARSGLFPYRQRAWIEPQRDAGPDLGVRDTIVLEYQPYDPAGNTGAAERFYFGRDVGWYEWERSGYECLFNRIGGPDVTPRRELICSP